MEIPIEGNDAWIMRVMNYRDPGLSISRIIEVNESSPVLQTLTAIIDDCDTRSGRETEIRIYVTKEERLNKPIHINLSNKSCRKYGVGLFFPIVLTVLHNKISCKMAKNFLCNCSISSINLCKFSSIMLHTILPNSYIA